MEPLNNLDTEIQSSILALLGAESTSSGSGAFLSDEFVVCSDARRVQRNLTNPSSPRATRDLESLVTRIGFQEAPRFSGGGDQVDGDIPLLMYNWYNIDLCSRCVFDLFFNCPRRRYDDSESVEPNRVFAIIIAVVLLFSSTILGVRNIVLFAKSVERSRKLLNFIMSSAASIRDTRNQQALLVASAKEAYKAEKSYMRIKLMFGILDLVLSAGLILILAASILAATSSVYLGGVLSCLTIVGLSLIGLVSIFYLPLLILERRARKRSAENIEKSLCFYLMAKQTPETISNFRLSSAFDFLDDDSGIRAPREGAQTSNKSPTYCAHSEETTSSTSYHTYFQSQKFTSTSLIGSQGPAPTPSAPPYEESSSPSAPPPSYEELEKSGAFSNKDN
ncbi:ABC transporter ATP-binding protein [Chlamydiifrater phoenicopteri]|uniref:ABC transporter ATP-binding protein n=1 Tax=Chlamydiifrater phoenicopteri TaxID=2681469 RepID=UPI001BCF25F8|nr:ABC transporter ATP-binding protein [Chlamydiifrater phoenicopteri]